MQDLNITIIQSALHWENIDANLAMFEEKIWQIRGKTDLIVLPEMFSTGFTMSAHRLSEPMNSKTTRWMRQLAEQTDAVIAGSFIVKENGHYFNRFLFMNPNGSYNTYDKRHLFRMAKEDETYTSGSKKLILEIKGWKVLPLICYDLRFPVFSRQQKDLYYDCLIYVANWPEKRRVAWNSLLSARAIENLSFVVGVNRVGTDGNGNKYSGDSSIISPDGEIIFTEKDKEVIESIVIKHDFLTSYRKSFPAYLDADEFSIKQ